MKKILILLFTILSINVYSQKLKEIRNFDTQLNAGTIEWIASDKVTSSFILYQKINGYNYVFYYTSSIQYPSYVECYSNKKFLWCAIIEANQYVNGCRFRVTYEGTLNETEFLE